MNKNQTQKGNTRRSVEGECEFLSTSQLGLTRICGLGSRGEALLALRAECGISARRKADQVWYLSGPVQH